MQLKREVKLLKQILIEGMTGNKGGKETFIINVYNKLLESNNYCFTFVAYDEIIAYEDYLINTGATVVHLPPRNKGLFRHLATLVRLFRKKHFDAVWSHKTTLSACELLFISKLFGVKKRIVHSHSSANMGGRFTLIMHTLNKNLIRWIATDYLACSESAAKWFYINEDYKVLNNGIDVERFKFNPMVRRAVRSSLNLNDSLVVGHIGRFGIEKNHMKLLNVFFALLQKHPDSKLVLCGDGDERHNIEARIKDLGITDNVILLGVIDNVHEILQALDVIVMPSLFEGLPFALLEAQASGLKCFVSDTVSRESNITGQIVFLPLELEDMNWAQVILDRYRQDDRSYSSDVLTAKGYNISSCALEVDKLLSLE